MWPAVVITLLVGILVGYLFTKIFLTKESPLVGELDKLTDEIAELQQDIKKLEQDNADLKYKLGEEEKARTYYQKKSDS